MSFKEIQKEKTAQIEQILKAYLPRVQGYQEVIMDAMSYSMLAGGKRLRPVLTLACCDLLGGSVEEAVPFAAAVEMIHAYSLIHDDLPCMDDDDLRRGKPTNHKVFGEAVAVLSGDGLQSLAYETMLSQGYNENAWKAARAVAQGAGSMGMVSGQVRDMQATGQEVSAETLQKIHAEKTGALILAACLAGAYMAGAKAQDMKA